MVSDFCLSLFWDHMPGGGMGGVGPPPAPRVKDLGASFWSCLLVIPAVLVLHHALPGLA